MGRSATALKTLKNRNMIKNLKPEYALLPKMSIETHNRPPPIPTGPPKCLASPSGSEQKLCGRM
jgi:hypothetical protein